MKVVVLGAGLAGLSSAYKLSEDGVDVRVLERDSHVGGLASSYREDGFTYDLGPHRFHSKDQSLIDHVRDLLDGEVEEKERISRILLQGRFFDYPLKVGNAVFTMPYATTARIGWDYLTVKLRNLIKQRPDSDFEAWVVNRFGWKLYEIYFKVYTEKTWGLPCTSLSADWAAQRISLLSLWDTLVKTLRIGETPRTYVSRFYYPNSGGIGRIGETYAERIGDNGGRITLDSEVEQVLVEDGNVTGIKYGGGSVDVNEGDYVFSTIPITDLVRSIRPKPPPDILEANDNLKYRGIVFDHLMLDRDRISRDHWIYLPELKYLANRVSESKNFNEDNAPAGKTVVGAELTCQTGDGIWGESREEVSERVVDDLAGIGLIEEAEYLGSSLHRVEHAYPIYDLNYRENLDKIINFLKKTRNLRFFGRNGLFRYNNMDHSVSMGLTAAKSITDENTDYAKIATEERWLG